ncbi:Gfo/Idh/MocA family protein [Dactylosporangium siamense]|uniref:Oxidoreductase n=1 Tax=Dactylosporangium siamense TaxID=685454 RepID=A0A919U5Q7_9ACTN|nr:Gfo/Idh/MocA family oxidoreductase [Dactylosporangium siamense]GIG42612.1 oxidoreductase [Dactylosporangium siamense]
MTPFSNSSIRVGLVGASLSGGWALRAHLPALAALPEFELTAVAASTLDSARRTADAHGVPLAFGDAGELARHPDVDLVTVAVRVPAHRAVIRAALAAGKHVYCEWPLAVDAAEARELADLAAGSGVVHAVGLQGLHSPSARFVRDLVAGGRIGGIWSAAAVFAAPGALGGDRIPRAQAWAADPAAGVDLLSVSGAHLLATLADLVGEPRELTAVVANTTPLATVAETGEPVAVGRANQVVIGGVLAGGGVLSVAVQGGSPSGAAGFQLRILGSAGSLTVTPAQPGGSMQIADWTVLLATGDGRAEPLPVPDGYRTVPAGVPAGPPANVAALYREIARAIGEGRPAHPDFRTAERYHDLVERVRRVAL